MSKTDGGPAFPIKISNNSRNSVPGLNDDEIAPGTATTYRGMTLRDYFAAKAMQGMAADPKYLPKTVDEVSFVAYSLADAMLVERSKGDA